MDTQSATKERPILFSGPMVRAILDGRKTVTRRVLTNAKRGDDCPEEMWQGAMGDIVEWREQEGRWFGLMGYRTLAYADCPYGKPGDRLWVREGVKQLGHERTGRNGQYLWPKFDDEEKARRWFDQCCYYTVDHHGQYDIEPQGTLNKLFMPRWASRITLEVVSSRAERLQEITDEDVIAEGFPRDDSPPHDGTRLNANGRRMCFAELWDRLNEKRGFSWKSDPFVWRVEFKRIDT